MFVTDLGSDSWIRMMGFVCAIASLISNWPGKEQALELDTFCKTCTVTYRTAERVFQQRGRAEMQHCQ